MRQQGLYRRRRIFCFRYKDESGVWKEKSTGHADRKDAVQFKQRWDEDNAAAALPTEKSIWTAEQACTRWVEQHVLKSAKAHANERSLLRQLLRSPLAKKKLKAIALDDLKSYQRERSKTVGPRAINLELRILIKVLKEANLWRRALSEHYRRLLEPESEIGQALGIEQLRRLEAVAASRDAWLVAYCVGVLASNTGLRGGEIKKLRIGSIDLENRRLSVARRITKSNAGARKVELNNAALSAITRLYLRAEALGATATDHFLLPADRSRHTRSSDPLHGEGFDVTYHQSSWRSAWRSLSKSAGFPGLRFHDLRHSFITMMGERGVPLQVVQAMVGHMSPVITKHYTHISSGAARRAVEMLEQREPYFVDVFVDKSKKVENGDSNLLN